MYYILRKGFLLLLLLLPFSVVAKVNVVTTTTTLRSLVEEVGGAQVKVESITRGRQDPHFVEAKPSYMVKMRRADLVVAVGLDLEVGWLPNILQGGRNPKVMPGNPGFLSMGLFMDPMEVSNSKIDRSQGDVHVLGNPHYLLDPLRAIKAADVLQKRLSELSSENKEFFKKNFLTFKEKVLKKDKEWQERIQKSKIVKVITYHKTLNYFLHHFAIKLAGEIEAKPGVPPTAKHILGLINKIKEESVSCGLIESFFETTAARRIKKSAKITFNVVPTEVESTKKSVDYVAMMEELVSSIEKCHE